MSKLVTVKNQPPIEICLQVDEFGTISSVTLYEFLELPPDNYNYWCKKNIEDNPYAFIGEDYMNYFTYEERGERKIAIYRLSVEFARKLSALSDSNRRHAAFNYFTRILDEHDFNESALAINCNAIDSREVAEMMGKRHDNLVRDIQKYAQTLEKTGELKIEVSDFFKESTYLSEQNKTLPCYLLTRKGCEFVANKMTGEKGIIFTAKYINRFHEMENELKSPSKPKQIDIKATEIKIRLSNQYLKLSKLSALTDEQRTTYQLKAVEVLDN
jgi:Rha family phage regulatory protein